MTARTLTANDRYDGDTETFVAHTLLKPSKGAAWKGNASDNLIADTLTSGSHPASNMPGRRREDDTNIVSMTLGADMARQAGGHPGTEEQVEMLNRVGAGVRRLTPRECERLQGFPDDWTLIPGASDSKRYAALGDAVTVPVAEWIGRRLMEVAA